MCQIARFWRHLKRAIFHVFCCSFSIKNKWKANLSLEASQHWCCQASIKLVWPEYKNPSSTGVRHVTKWAFSSDWKTAKFAPVTRIKQRQTLRSPSFLCIRRWNMMQRWSPSSFICLIAKLKEQHSSKAQNSLPKFTWNWAQLWPHTVHRVVRLGNCHCFCSKPYEYVEHVWEGQACILRIHWTRLIPRKLPKRPFLEASGGRFIDALNLLGTASGLHMSSYTLQRTFCESFRKIGQELRSGQPLAGHELFVGKKNRFVQLSRIATRAALVFTRPRLHYELALA